MKPRLWKSTHLLPNVSACVNVCEHCSLFQHITLLCVFERTSRSCLYKTLWMHSFRWIVSQKIAWHCYYWSANFVQTGSVDLKHIQSQIPQSRWGEDTDHGASSFYYNRYNNFNTCRVLFLMCRIKCENMRQQGLLLQYIVKDSVV